MKRLAVLALGIAGCVAHIPPHTVHVPPLVGDVRPPQSIIFLQSQVSLAPLAEALERGIPRTRSDEIPLGAGIKLKTQISRRPLSVRAGPEGLILMLSADVSFASEGGSVACTSRGAVITLKVITRPELASDGWLIVASPKSETEIAGELRCGIVPIPLHPILSPIAFWLARGLEETVRLVRLPMAPLINEALDALAQRCDITVGDEVACLDLDPRALVLSPAAGSGDALTLKLGVDVAPRLSTGKCTGPPRRRPRSPVVAREVPLGDRFGVEVALTIAYDQLGERAAPSLRGKSFGEGKQRVNLRQVTFGDAEGRVLARAQVDGAIAGTLFLWGTPAISEREGRFTLAVPDLQVAVETRDLLTRMKLWLWDRHDGGLANWLRGKLTVDITERLTAARAALTGRRELLPSVALVTSFTQVLPSKVASRPGALTAKVVLIGTAELQIK